MKQYITKIDKSQGLVITVEYSKRFRATKWYKKLAAASLKNHTVIAVENVDRYGNFTHEVLLVNAKKIALTRRLILNFDDFETVIFK